MGIINRTMDSSEQKESVRVVARLPVNQSEILVPIERACTLDQVKATLVGISGAPDLLVKSLRFVVGTGGSTFNIGTTQAIAAYGTSGIVTYSLPAAGSTLLNLQAGDCLALVTGGGTGAAATATVVDIVLKNIQDIKTWF